MFSFRYGFHVYGNLACSTREINGIVFHFFPTAKQRNLVPVLFSTSSVGLYRSCVEFTLGCGAAGEGRRPLSRLCCDRNACRAGAISRWLRLGASCITSSDSVACSIVFSFSTRKILTDFSRGWLNWRNGRDEEQTLVDSARATSKEWRRILSQASMPRHARGSF